MVKNRQAVILGVFIIALLYVYMASYEIVQEEEHVKECVEQAKCDMEWDKTMRAVMIKGKLYYDTEKESPPRYHCGVLHGAITSTVDESQMPNEDNQSNFGTGFGYCYITDDAIELHMNDKWVIFVCQNEA